ncbi:hypothetical protein HWQ46_01895 [Shewanella sp. D64]|uniref:hypothetical protein n=1 Tax=unclassified Shewanella TaxID=196818 RepID=UPI0022BA121F|nr:MULTISPECIES: hypothetical protein [unclassified Shewanella]MEC4724300.1 hypothetical protein [Shewanella sp. D64]MEC4738812.1 hypothetical protein [Shewanella sp. E94]WBJ97749.1 hypothetical protein HWQ47_11960 [Shewanella sp. MTB7]
MMESRKTLVTKLVEYIAPIDDILEELKSYGWDSEIDLVTLKPSHLVNVLERFISDDLSDVHVRDWTNGIEHREDIGLLSEYKDTLDEMIFWLANSAINYPITKDLAKRVIKSIQSNNVQ